jgi:excisionase family DNA binding protein
MRLNHSTEQRQPETNSELLTVPEVAALLRVQVSTIRAWVLHRRIAYVKVFGKLVRFRRADVESLIASRVVPAETGAAQ